MSMNNQFELINKLYHGISSDQLKPEKKLDNSNSYTFLKENPDIELHSMNGLMIPFSSQWKNIGINLSGGADSACLTMLLCDIILKNNYDCKIHIITHCRGWDTKPWQLPISIKVYNKLKDTWPNIIDKRFENFIPPEMEHGNSGTPFKDEKGEKQSGDNIEVDSFNRYITYKEKLNATFNATTLNPSSKDFLSRLETEQPPKRSNLVENGNVDNLITRHYWKYPIYDCTPFVFVEKNIIMKFYDLYDNHDLLNLTRSCEGDIFHFNMKLKDYTEDMDVPLCGKCYWCIEREWAIEKNENE